MLLLEIIVGLRQSARVRNVAQIELELPGLLQSELRQLRDGLDGLTANDLEFTLEFESAMQLSERDWAEERSSLFRQR